jgi:CDP-glycerol glycerophosphotransferase
MPRISVVIPIYNVEPYLAACLDSVARQTESDLEVILVDDGSTDASGAIADAYAAGDARFRVVRRPNGGLSAARNTGVEHATGELLAFVDSDDLLPPDAYALLLDALDRSGSDFASGHVRRMGTWGSWPARFLDEAFATTRLATHVTRFWPLLADRTAWNKLFRRAFWDAHALRFPVGVLHEDIPVMLPAHFMARSVDVISDPVYRWRYRDDRSSITQGRLSQRVLLDRLVAVQQVSDYLAAQGPPGAQRRYHIHVLSDDLALHLKLLDLADEGYRDLFCERVNALLDADDETIYDDLEPIARLKWRLVRERQMPALVEILRSERGRRNNRAAAVRGQVARRVPMGLRPHVHRVWRTLRRAPSG